MNPLAGLETGDDDGPETVGNAQADTADGSADRRLPQSSVGRDRAEPVDPATAERVNRFAHEDYHRVVAIVRTACGPRADAEGAVSEAVARLLDHAVKGRPVANLAAWVTQVAINVGRSELRHLRIRSKYEPVLWERSSRTGRAEQIAEDLDVRLAISRLPRRQAQVVALRYGLDLPLTEIAHVLGLTVGGTKASLAKARRAVARSLGVQGE